MENFEVKTKVENEADEEDESEHTEKEEQNAFFNLPPNLYHRINVNDGSRNIDVMTPAHNMDFAVFIDLVTYIYFLTCDDEVRSKSRLNVVANMRDLSQLADKK